MNGKPCCPLKSIFGDNENRIACHCNGFVADLHNADIHTVLLGRGLARSSVPSKLYSILASARPVVASVDEGTEVARVLEGAGAGVAVDAEDEAGFLAALEPLLRDEDRRSALGVAGRAWVERWLSPAAVAERYEILIEELVAARAPGPGG